MDFLDACEASECAENECKTKSVNMANNSNSERKPYITNICAYCLKDIDHISLCGKCRKRKLCSKECQVADWRSGHKHFCGQSGELDTDYEIALTEDKGYAMLAKRQFSRGEKIIAERPMMCLLRNGEFVNNEGYNEAAIMDLSPTNSSDIMRKFENNAMTCQNTELMTDPFIGLFMMIARANHACLANTQPTYLLETKNMVLVASRQIEVGEEITYQYISDYSPESYVKLLTKWGFRCRCRACVCPEIGEMLQRISDFDTKLMNYGRTGKYDMALRCGKTLISLYDKLQESPRFYERTYYDMFQMAVARSSTLADATKYINLALESHIQFLGPDGPNAAEYRIYANNPASHKNYLTG